MLLIDSTKSLSPEGKLIGGQKVSPGQKKFLVSCRHRDMHKCTGFLISINQVLTQAYCLKEFFEDEIIPNFDDYSVVAGLNDSFSSGGVTYLIGEVQAHRKYIHKNPKPSGDIALITVGHYYI